MNWIKNNIYKILIVLLGALGVFTGIMMTDLWYIVAGISLGFIMVGFFVLYFDPKNKLKHKTLSIIIWVLGAISGFLVGYRNQPSSPWRWDVGLISPDVVIESYVDLLPSLIPWIISLIFGLIIWALGSQKNQAKS